MENLITYPIKVVSHLTGLSIHVIRAWERRYSVVVPTRTETNRRLYSADDLEKLTLLSHAVKEGYSIGLIASKDIDELREIAGYEKDDNNNFQNTQYSDKQKMPYLDKCIDAVKNLNSNMLEKELYRALVDLTQPKFINEVITPLLYKIGDMWKNGDIRIVNEHISTAVIRKILTSLIDNNSVPSHAPSIVIATPKGQLHELGALIIAVIASSDGWNAIYMGPDLPGEEIAAAINKLNPKIVALSIVYPNDDFTLDREMLKLKKMLNNGSKIIAGGRSVLIYQKTLKSMNAIIVKDIDEFRNELNNSRD